MSELGAGQMLLDERVGSVRRLTLNRPERRNALHPDQLGRLRDVVNEASADESISAVTIEGAGEAAFSAGFDIDVLAQSAEGTHPSTSLFEAVTALAACRKPTFALIRGHCLGAGFDLAMACDFRLGCGDVRFGVPAVRLGTVYEPRSVDRIQRLIGPTVTKELFVMGRELGGERALAVGILQELVGADRDLDAALSTWLSERSDAAEGHKLIIDALVATVDRSARFWEPLDRLRAESLSSRERKRALSAFQAGER
jgi:enoyl-CoA hydratase/carnithine racemase